MKNLEITFAILLFPMFLFAQNFNANLTEVTTLNNTINESSGLLNLQDSYFTHNDDTDAKLFEFDIFDGEILREVEINNATNVDWEDVTKDENFVYIGDFGNNNGSRTNLKIYKCPINSTTGNLDDFVTPSIINFSYAEQTDFNPGNKNHNFDAEAIINIGDNLFLFTKNWVNSKTHIYKVNKTPGTYVLNKIDEIEVPGLVTAATYLPSLNTIALIGYTEIAGVISDNFVTAITNFGENLFSDGTILSANLTASGSKKTEAIVKDASNYNFYLSAEANAGFSQTLYQLNVETIIDSILVLNDTITNPIDTMMNDTTFIVAFENLNLAKVLFNGNTKTINIISAENTETQIFNIASQKVATSYQKNINVNFLPKGVYLVKVLNHKNQILQRKKISIW